MGQGCSPHILYFPATGAYLQIGHLAWSGLPNWDLSTRLPAESFHKYEERDIITILLTTLLLALLGVLPTWPTARVGDTIRAAVWAFYF